MYTPFTRLYAEALATGNIERLFRQRMGETATFSAATVSLDSRDPPATHTIPQ